MKKLLTTIVILAFMAPIGNAFGYEDVYPEDAADMVYYDGAYILDVRTPQEWNWVGHPGVNRNGEGEYLDYEHVLNVPYEVYHEGYMKGDVLIVNNQFVKDVKRLLGKDATIITMCRSGVRSVSAAIALEDAGFTDVYNMVTGFEGDKDYQGYRTVNGWKVVGLPYNYSGVGDYKD
ncbi:rhodanese-like domain-containing protein [Desulfocastanea catecholica]